jgi:peptide/nickel transport system substrate-binding protein
MSMADALVLALPRVEFLPPGRVTDDTSILTLRSLVFEPLCTWQDGRVRPGLLGAWRHEDEGRGWIFAIRRRATYHDDRPVTAEEVAETIRAHLQGLDMFGMPWAYARYLQGARVTAEGPGLLSISTPEPVADLPEILSEFFHLRPGTDGGATLGTGPYRVLRHVPGASAVLEAVDPDRLPRRIGIVAEPDADLRYRMVADGSVDAATHLERMSDPRSHAGGLAWGAAANAMSVMFYLDCRRGLFSRDAARRAVNLAVDGQAIVDEVFHGMGLPAATAVSPFHLGFREARVAPVPQDRDAARRLLDQAGGPSEILIRTPLRMPEKAPDISAMVAHQLSAVGIRARVEEEHDRPDYARQVGRGKIGDMAIFDSTPASTYRVLSDKVSSLVKGPWWQGYDDAAFERQFAAASRTIDDAERAAAYGRCLRRLQENPPWLYLFHPVETFAARPGMAPMALDHRGILRIG